MSLLRYPTSNYSQILDITSSKPAMEPVPWTEIRGADIWIYFPRGIAIGDIDWLDVKFAARLAIDLERLVCIAEAQKHVIADRHVRDRHKEEILLFNDQVHKGQSTPAGCGLYSNGLWNRCVHYG